MTGAKSVRVLDRRRTTAVVGAVVVLGLAVAAAFLSNGALMSVSRYTFAEPCPSGAPSSGCLATLPADVVTTWDDYGEGEPYERQLGLDVPDAPADTPTNPYDGTVMAWLTITEAERLGIPDDTTGDAKITVTMFDTMVVGITGPHGERAETRPVVRPAAAALELAMWSLAVALVIGVAGYVRRRLTGRHAAWLWPTLAAVGSGLLIGMTAVLATGTLWAFAAAYVVMAVVVATLTTRISAPPVVADEVAKPHQDRLPLA